MPARGARWEWLVLAGILACAAALLLYETRGLIFYYDEWSFLLGRRENDADAFLAPHNEHPVLVPVLVWKAMWTVFGTDGYLPYRLLIITVHLTICVLLFLVARSRVGAPLALVLTTLLAFFGPAFEDLLWPFQISFIGPVGCWLAIVLALDRGRDGLAAVLLTVALFSSGSGAPVAAGTAVAVLLGPDPWWRALRVLGVPLGLFLAWGLTYGVRGGLRLGDIPSAPRVVFDSAAASLGAFAGLPWPWGRALALALAVAVAWRLARRRGPVAGLLAALATPLAFWGAQVLFRGAPPAPPPSHYLYPGAVFLVLVIIELVPRDLPPPRLPVAAVAIALTAAIVAVNVGVLRDGAEDFRTTSELVAAELGALELTRGRVEADFMPDPVLAPQITAGPYFAAIDRTGSIADAPAAIAERSELARQAADVTLLLAQPTAREPGRGDRCAPRPGELPVPSGGIVLRASDAPATVALRRFAAGYARPDRPPGRIALADIEHLATAPFSEPPVFPLPAGVAMRLAPPGDGWTARVQGAGPVLVCAR